ncbi:MAG: Gfo/Idh/MocA family oxidoreductase [Fimbriimonadaceae bacterium]|nr:Gfo/Idh/MocA family oxidoreductase [Fimbriimonadaceae bacterium]
MADRLRVGVIGTGDPDAKKSALGYAMAYAHGDGYRAAGDCDIVAACDLRADLAQKYADRFGPAEVYTDYRAMFAAARLDVVSICTWMHLHEPMVLAAIDAGVKAIHCEKPMADTWRGALNMAAKAAAAGVQLTFNHQRRYSEATQIARQLIDAGEIGAIQRFECEFGNIYDTGTHFIDMLSHFNGEVRAKWVLAQIDYRTENLVFGAPCENQQTLIFEYENGVFGFVYSGAPGGSRPLGVVNRIIGEQGVIDWGCGHGPKEALRWRPAGSPEWQHPDTNGHSIHGPDFIERAVSDVIACLRSGRKCILDASNALIATELIFGAYESSRRRARVDFPLDPTIGNPLREMVEAGDLQPAKPAA